MEQIKHLNLTENDFKMIIDGLDALPDAGRTGAMLGDLVGTIFADKMESPEAKQNFLRQKEKLNKDFEHKRDLVREDVRILQGKLLMLKRYLTENKLMGEVDDILKQTK